MVDIVRTIEKSTKTDDIHSIQVDVKPEKEMIQTTSRHKRQKCVFATRPDAMVQTSQDDSSNTTGRLSTW